MDVSFFDEVAPSFALERDFKKLVKRILASRSQGGIERIGLYKKLSKEACMAIFAKKLIRSEG